MDITKSNPHGVLIIERLNTFEKHIGVKLPADYRNYLIQYNGGLPKRTCFGIPGSQIASRIHHLYGLNDGPSYQKLDQMLEIYRARIPDGILPIADDPFGNLICIGIATDNYGKIFFWDHEIEPLYLREQSLEQISLTFTSFISDLYEDEIYNSDIVKAIKSNDLNYISKLIEKGYDIEKEDEYGHTLLENAAIFNRLKIIQLLYDNGASLKKSLDYAKENVEFFPDHQETVDLITKLIKQ